MNDSENVFVNLHEVLTAIDCHRERISKGRPKTSILYDTYEMAHDHIKQWLTTVFVSTHKEEK